MISWCDIVLKEEQRCPLPGMISESEQKLLYWLAEQFYKGLGEIVELGCFLGTSNFMLAGGLRTNPRPIEKLGRIHTYDLFLHDRPAFNPWMEKIGVPFGGSFQQAFERCIAPHRDLVTLYPGDVLKRGWAGRPIEILFVDIARTWELNQHVVSTFFRSLMPQGSMVIQQDYFYPLTPWIAITMEYFRDYFEAVQQAETSLVFVLQRPLPESLLATPIAGLPAEEKEALMDRQIARMQGNVTPMLELGKVRLLYDTRGKEAAQDLLNDIAVRYKDASWLTARIAGFMGEIEDSLVEYKVAA